MAKTPSNMLALGTQAPGFSLTDVLTGQTVTLQSPESTPTATVICFICNHCPYVRHINQGLTQLANDYLSQNIRFIAINANDTEAYPDDAPEHMKTTAEKEGYPFPYLFDETQEVAKAYKAACTPDFFVFNKTLQLAYRGQLDDSRPGNNLPVDGASIRDALDCLIQNKPVSTDQKPSIGCNIKWKATL